ncbi:forespore capture DNA-binding protein RefZ [Bacillus sp. B1-b2]|uniref:forespore capture DNA-binding protein RefZ n=1 Tax=Bacillus sp. B1-b2 TaxID=2653201 RepID=UPI00126157C8|nr:forespore capture DNA-binding protein RefZ [Bacillus sp. B1-b2]KAB7666765.1 TetR/AcrR family transcriptional regulator [Bacillus sp. B1-b2]
MKKNPTKDSIVEAAIALFNTKGYNGTSIRDIAGLANVNIANISYYFNGKQGLLEYCYIHFFEAYIALLEKVFRQNDTSPTVKLKNCIEGIISFQCQNPQLTRFVLREVSIDSQVVREIMSTYSVKEKYIFTKIIEEGIARKEFNRISIPYSIIQIKGFLSMPFIHSYYLKEVLHVFLHEDYFQKKYVQEINKWIDEIICTYKKELYTIN